LTRTRAVARAWVDEAFRERLKADPRAAVAEETGYTVPGSIAIAVLEETPDHAHLVIPANRMAVSDENLDFAGGSYDGAKEYDSQTSCRFESSRFLEERPANAGLSSTASGMRASSFSVRLPTTG